MDVQSDYNSQGQESAGNERKRTEAWLGDIVDSGI